MTLPPKPAIRPANPRFSSGPCTKRPGWTPEALNGALLGRNHRQPETKARIEAALLKTRDLLELPDDYRVALVPASDTGAVEMALWSLLGPRGVDVLAWEAFSRDWVTDILDELEAHRRPPAAGGLWQSARPLRSRFRPRRGVRLERHHLRRARAERRLDRGRPQGSHHLRRHLRRVRPRHRLAEARCDHLFLAESAGRRGAARHADPVSARDRAAGELRAALAAAEAVPPDQERQGDGRSVRGLDHQHAVHAVPRGLYGRARLRRKRGRAQGHHGPGRRQRGGDRRLGRQDALGRVHGAGARDPLQHVRLPQDRRSRDRGAAAGGARCLPAVHGGAAQPRRT